MDSESLDVTEIYNTADLADFLYCLSSLDRVSEKKVVHPLQEHSGRVCRRMALYDPFQSGTNDNLRSCVN